MVISKSVTLQVTDRVLEARVQIRVQQRTLSSAIWSFYTPITRSDTNKHAIFDNETRRQHNVTLGLKDDGPLSLSD